jgi:hypothetical protein
VPHPEAIAGGDMFTPDLCELEESLQGVSICEVLDRVRSFDAAVTKLYHETERRLASKYT